MENVFYFHGFRSVARHVGQVQADHEWPAGGIWRVPLDGEHPNTYYRYSILLVWRLTYQ